MRVSIGSGGQSRLKGRVGGGEECLGDQIRLRGRVGGGGEGLGDPIDGEVGVAGFVNVGPKGVTLVDTI